MRKNVPRVRVLLLTGFLACTCCWIGCGEGKSTGSISGKVTYQGKPQTTGVVLLADPDAGIGATAVLDASGTYKILSLPTGEYQVAIGQPPVPTPEQSSQGAQIVKLDIPDKYLDPRTSGLTATIREGENSADFSL